MARTARDACRQTARLGLLALVGAGCATVQEPPGGPPDFIPPAILSVTPDSGAIVPGWKDAVVFRFDGVVTEPVGPAREQLFVVSPRPEALEVSWRRTALAVKPKDGWRAGAVYQVSLEATVSDLRNNRLAAGRTVIFSTGGEIKPTVISGTVVDWETAKAAVRPLVEALHLSDSLVYIALGDSSGGFGLTHAPPGEYVVYGVLDKNTNRRRDPRENFDSALVTLDSSGTVTLWAFAHDTVGPQLRAVTRLDSVTIQLEFNQALAPKDPTLDDVSVGLLPDSTPVPVAAVWRQAVYDSMQAAGRDSAGGAAGAGGAGGAADTARRTAVPDTTGPRPRISLPRPPAIARTPARPRPGAPGARAAPAGPPPVDSALVRLLAQRPPLSPRLVLRVVQPLAPDTRYVVGAAVSNPSGVRAESRLLLIVPAAKEPPPAAPVDSARRAPADSARLAPSDSARPAPADSARLAPADSVSPPARPPADSL